MVMAPDQGEEVQQDPVIEDGGDAEYIQEDTPDEVAEAPQEAPAAEEPPASEVAPVPIDTVSPVQQSDANQQAVEELQRQRQVTAQKEWEQQVFKQAQGVEKQAMDRGADPQTARQLARQFVSGRKEIRDHDTKSVEVLAHVEGRQNAAMHYAQKHKLIGKQAADDLMMLARTRSPQEMDIEAQRIAQLRSQAAEITRLKQGRVAPQAFDNSQGSAESTTNTQRLVDQYNNGDRSEAAVSAVRKLVLGN
jgi:hypothetical protein